MYRNKRTIFRQGVKQHGLVGFWVWYFKEADNRLLGKLVEWRGNKVQIEGKTFSVDLPQISTAQKSQFIQGRYEGPERNAMKRHLDPDLPVIEVGGFIGVVACLTNQRLADPERHIVVEANPTVLPILEANRARNYCRFRIVNRAIAYDADVVSLHIAGVQSSLVRQVSQKQVQIPAVTLRELAEQHGFERFNLICDIEGTELDLVAHEGEFLAAHVPLIIMEIHTGFLPADRVEALIDRLKQLGFRLVDPPEIYTYVFKNEGLGSV